MTANEILNQKNENGSITIENESAGWFAISRNGLHYIEFSNEEVKFYANENSWAKRIITLTRRGY